MDTDTEALVCPDCNGDGGDLYARHKDCPTCHGVGHLPVAAKPLTLGERFGAAAMAIDTTDGTRAGLVQMLLIAGAEFDRQSHAAKVDEAIVAAAVMLDDEVWQLPRPARHHHILWALDQVLPGRAIEAHVQGFMTSAGRFVEREEAARIASMAGQVSKLSAPPNLFSEDLW